MTSVRASTFVFFMVAAEFLPGFTQSLADELPEDTNHIASLTPDQARKLVEEFPGVPVEVEMKGGGKLRLAASCLPLNGLKWLDAETAKVLTGYRKGPLVLDGLTVLSGKAAEALAQHKGSLSLCGLTTLSDEAAKALMLHEGYLYLNGLTTLSDEAAKALAQHKGDYLTLDGLSSLSGEVATELAQHGAWLHLNGLTTLSQEVGMALAQHSGCLHLNGLTTLSDEQAATLAQHKGEALSLNGLTTLSNEAARALAQYDGWLLLNGLTTLAGEVASALTQHEGRLTLNGLTTLSAEAAKAVAAAEAWDGYLPALTSLDSPDSVAIASGLATRKGRLSLPNLKKLSPKTLSALIEKEDIEIPLIETLELIPEPDGGTTEDFVIPEAFQKEQQK